MDHWLREKESRTVEFKRDLSSLTPILKTVVAFANTAGGILIIGKESDGRLVGIEGVLAEEERLANAIAHNILPSILPEIEIVTVQGKDLLVIKVSHWKGPFYLKRQGIPRGVYVRLGSTSRPAGPDMVAEIQRHAANITYDEQPLPELTLEDLDTTAIRRHLKEMRSRVSPQKLGSLEVITTYDGRLVPSIGGLIVFGKLQIRAQIVPDARVRCARFRGCDKAYILDQYEPEGTILDAIEGIEHFIERNTRLAGEIKSIRRRDVPEYSPIAVREALINALVHADYSLSGATIQIAIFDDRLEIQNPGMLPFGYTLEDLKAGTSRIRNRVLARVFRKMSLIEEWGSGYKRIITACREEGYPIPDWYELGSAIRVSF